MCPLPTSKGTERAQKQNLDKSHENMEIKNMCFFFGPLPNFKQNTNFPEKKKKSSLFSTLGF